MSDDDVLLACNRVRDLRDPIVGASITFCMDCKTRIWIAPTGVELVAQQPFVKTICIACFGQRVEREGPPTEGLRVAPGAFQELRENGMSEQLIARLELIAMEYRGRNP